MMPTTLGQLKREKGVPRCARSVKDEIRANLIRKLQQNEPLFPGIIGYEESVLPAIINAILSRHNMILLGLRGQAKSRILRCLTHFLDEEIPYIEGSEIHDDPFFPISSESRRRVEAEGDDLPIAYWRREDRFVEKLATPDVTVADIIGDLDPIKAARTGRELSSDENMHYGLLPRAHRGIFAVNELPDLAPKIQVALFNIMQEGDVQIKGFPVRLPLDVMMVFSANPEDYTARGKIITPLKDRIGSEIRTHYPDVLQEGVEITRQESWTERGAKQTTIPEFIREIVELVAFSGRQDKRIDKRSGVSQRLPITCLENSVSNAERRAITSGEKKAVLRIADIYASIPAVTGKLELEYEGELQGADNIARELILGAVFKTFEKYFPDQEFDRIVQWFDLGGEVKIDDQTPAADYLKKVGIIQGLEETLSRFGLSLDEQQEEAVSMIEFILEGLHAQKKLSRSEERGYHRERQRHEEDFFGDIPQSQRRSFN